MSTEKKKSEEVENSAQQNDKQEKKEPETKEEQGSDEKLSQIEDKSEISAQEGKDTEQALENQQKKIEELENELKEFKDKYLRLAAEFDNYKKRMARQFETIVKTANDELILEIIDIFDNFERALNAAKSSEDFASFHKGIEMIFKQLKEILQKRGLQRIEALNTEFDPNFHEAISQIEVKDKPSNMVVEEIQAGYLLGDRVIRAAKVVVSK